MKLIKACLIATTLATPVAAQQNLPFEFGADAGAFHISFSPGASFSELDFPVRSLRMAMPIDPKFAVEPRLGLTHVSGDGGSATSYSLDVGLLVEFSDRRAPQRWYLRPFLGYDHARNGAGNAGQTSIGLGGGLRAPVSDRIAMRFEAEYRHLFERRGVSGNSIGLLAGFSVFTH